MTLIEELEKAIEDLEVNYGWENCTDEDMVYDLGKNDGLQMAINIIKSHSDWIPVSEPPKENGEYLTTIKDSMGEIQMFVMTYENYCWRTFFGDKVLAWRPIPKPYEGESK